MGSPMTDQCRLYLISPPVIADAGRFAENLRAALAGGDVACFQLRMKSAEGVSAPDEEILAVAEAIAPILRAKGVHFLVNDRPDLARRAGADGVHVGQTDAALADARKLLGAGATIGVTCHDSYDLAMKAAEAGADYVAFGAFFPTRTKEAPTRAELSLIEDWSYATVIPSVTIGGIDAANCGALVRAGADFIAVSSAVWSSGEGPAAAVGKLNEAIAEAAQAARHD